jgi:hypothetical protein
LILCVGLGGLAAWGWNLGVSLWHKLSLASPRPWWPAFGYRLSAVLLVAVAGGGLLVRNYGLVDESGDRSGQAVMAELACELSGTPGETWLTAESGYAGPLVTYIGQRIGRPLVWANPWRDWDYLGALTQGRRVFLVNDMPGGWQYPDALKRLSAPYRYLLPTGSPDLLELVVEPPDGSIAGQGPVGSPLPLDVGYVVLDQPFGPAILLRGYAWRVCDQPQGRLLRLTLYWQAQAQVDQDWRVKAHLVDTHGGMLAQADSEHPARGARPTSSWQPGQVVRDTHDFYLPAKADFQSAHAVVGLYQIIGDEFPTLAETEIEVRQAR